MNGLSEQNIDGAVWIVGTLKVYQKDFEEMAPESDGSFRVVLRHNGWAYYYDGLFPEFDFTHGFEDGVVYFHISKENIFAKRPE